LPDRGVEPGRGVERRVPVAAGFLGQGASYKTLADPAESWIEGTAERAIER
jgi:hypothetical protein